MNKNEQDVKEEGQEAGEGGARATRARNRTVLLTPDVTGQVRARLNQAAHAGAETPAPAPTPAAQPQEENSDDGFVAVARKPAGEGFGAPRARPQTPQPPPAPQTQSSHPQPAPTRPSMEQRTVSVAAAPLRPAAAPHQPQQAERPKADSDGIIWTKKTKVVGFLVSFDVEPEGQIFVLRSGRFVVTSQEAQGGSSLLLNHPSVSPMHAVVRVGENGEMQILDQLSESGTRILKADGKEINLSGDKGMVGHGDTVSFGERKFHVTLLSLPD